MHWPLLTHFDAQSLYDVSMEQSVGARVQEPAPQTTGKLSDAVDVGAAADEEVVVLL